MSSCLPEPSITNAAVVLNDDDNNTLVATYTCNSGFSMSGTARVTCNVSTGVWLTSLPSCSTIQEDIHITTNVHTPDLHEEWWFYLLAGLLGLISICLITWLIMWCCCGLSGWCFGGRTPVHPHPHYQHCGGHFVHHGAHCNHHHGGSYCRCGTYCGYYDGPGSPKKRQNKSNNIYWVGACDNQFRWGEDAHCAACRAQQPHGTSTGPISTTYVPSPPKGRNHKMVVNTAHSPPVAKSNSNEVALLSETEGSGDAGLCSVDTPPYKEVQLARALKIAKDPAKANKIWMPHSNPVRQINTSTK